MEKTLVIIPAKGSSGRLSNKNILLLNGIPLFLHSCYYARNEGFKNIVVSSDSDYLLTIARNEGFDTFKEVVDESRLENCINQVLYTYTDFDKFVVLQPTSPLRKEGVLREITGLNVDCVISIQRIKPIAFYKGEAMFDPEYRQLSQDCTEWIEHFDGSIIVRNIDNYMETKLLVTIDSERVENEFPYYLQIDSKEEFDVLNQIILQHLFK